MTNFGYRIITAMRDNEGFQSEVFQRWQALYTRLFDSRWTMLALVVLGIARVLFFLLAYAPADGADANDYYAYAAYINGVDLPSRVANVPPLYPMLVYVNHYLLGNFNLIIMWQMVMSASLGLLYYLGLRKYNALLAVLTALIVIGDAQTGVSFNLTSTEPLYVFLLACVYALTLIQHQTVAKNALHWRDVLLGVLLVLLRETRTVARYAIVPVWILFAIATRNWKRAVVIALSFVVTTAFFELSTEVTQVAQQESNSDNMLLRPLLVYGLLDVEAGAASAELQANVERCQADEAFTRIFPCLESYYGSSDAAQDLVNRAYVESVSERPFAIYERMFEEFTDFLKLSGQQVYGTPTPAAVQCEDIPARIERQVERMMAFKWDGLTISPEQVAAYTEVATDFINQMCPPAATNSTIHDITDWIAFRYRSLSRTNPYLWYFSLIVLVFIIPWARKLWLPVFLAGGLLAYHAAISAALFNVQPRYTMVTNPFKGILLISVFVILGYLVLKVLDVWFSKSIRD